MSLFVLTFVFYVEATVVTSCIFSPIKSKSGLFSEPDAGLRSAEIHFLQGWHGLAPPVAWHGTPDPPVPSSPLSAQRRQSFWLTGASRSRDIKDPVVSDAIRGDQDGIGGLIQRRDVGSKWFWLIQIMEPIPIIKDIYETELKRNQVETWIWLN